MKTTQCKTCKKEIKVSPKLEKGGRGKYCSRECYYTARTVTTVDKQCSNCQNIFQVPKWKEYVGKKDWFCNSQCWITYRKNHPEYHKKYGSSKLDAHPVLTKELIEQEYLTNGLKMRDIATKYGYGYVTVNKWVNKYQIKTRRMSDYQTKTTFSSISREVRKERNNTCEICGWNKGTCDVHHKVAQKNNGTHDKENLIVLCPNCHRLVTESKLKI
jgi:transposase-like protein